jgi:hypothetical protein
MAVNVSQRAQRVAGWHSASVVYGSSPEVSILFFIDVLHWRKYFIMNRHLVKKAEIRFIIGDIQWYDTQMVLYNIIMFMRSE